MGVLLNRKFSLVYILEISKLKNPSTYFIFRKNKNKKLRENKNFYANSIFDKINFVVFFNVTQKIKTKYSKKSPIIYSFTFKNISTIFEL